MSKLLDILLANLDWSPITNNISVRKIQCKLKGETGWNVRTLFYPLPQISKIIVLCTITYLLRKIKQHKYTNA